MDEIDLLSSLKKYLPSEDKEKTEANWEWFWNAYNKKMGKEAAKKKFSALTDKDQEEIRLTLPKFLADYPILEYRPHPLTYLNQRRWRDYVENGVVHDVEKAWRI